MSNVFINFAYSTHLQDILMNFAYFLNLVSWQIDRRAWFFVSMKITKNPCYCMTLLRLPIKLLCIFCNFFQAARWWITVTCHAVYPMWSLTCNI